jgi:type VI secretion system secreted protein Hcp
MADMFLLLQGIPGESLDEAEPLSHKNEIEIRDWKWSVDNSADHKLSSDKAAAKTNVKNITIDKIIDVASVTLLQFCAKGTHIPRATITCRKNHGEYKVEYLTIDLTDVMIHSVEWTGAGSETFVAEKVELEFGEFDISYSKQGNRNPEDGWVEFGWDVQNHRETASVRY